MEVQQPVSTTLHILTDRQNVVGWHLVLNKCMQTPPNPTIFWNLLGERPTWKLTLRRHVIPNPFARLSTSLLYKVKEIEHAGDCVLSWTFTF